MVKLLRIVCVLAAAIGTRQTSLEAADFVELPGRGEVAPAVGAQADIPERFHLPQGKFAFDARFERLSGPVRVSKITFPTPVATDIAENNTVHAHYFQPAGAGPFPAVVVLHILGGDFELSQTIANSLARRGVAALFVKLPYYGERRARGSSRRMISKDPRESVIGMTQGVLDVRRAGQWLAGRPEVDGARLGVMGISLGGIMAALSGAADPQFRSIAVMIAGGNLARSIWENPIPEAGQFREAWQAAGGTQESFERILAEVDPAHYGARLRNRRVLLVAAEHDEVFPQTSTRALWDSTDRKARLVWMPDVGHYTCIRFLFREVDRMTDFFREVERQSP